MIENDVKASDSVRDSTGPGSPKITTMASTTRQVSTAEQHRQIAERSALSDGSSEGKRAV